MLILSRRPQEKIVFPTLGVSIEVASVHSKLVKLGIDAPREIPVLRGELALHPKIQRPAGAVQSHSEHALRNILNRSHLAILLAQKQLSIGREEAAALTLQRALGAFDLFEQQCESDARLQGAAFENSPGHSGKRALVVDDDRNEGELLAGIMRMNGFKVEIASDGFEALQTLSTGEPPDVVLLDMLMPRCDGASTIRAIRAEPRYAGLKVFAVSGASPASLGVETGPNGCNRWFPKPVQPEMLMRELRRELEGCSPELTAAC